MFACHTNVTPPTRRCRAVARLLVASLSLLGLASRADAQGAAGVAQAPVENAPLAPPPVGAPAAPPSADAPAGTSLTAPSPGTETPTGALPEPTSVPPAPSAHDAALAQATPTAASGPIVEPSVPVGAAPPPETPHARLDYAEGTFYMRAINDNLILVPSGRMQIDTYAYSGPGVAGYHRANGTGLKANLFFRRFVIEFGGIVNKKWFFWVGGNFAPTSVDGAQNSISTANVYDGFIGYMPVPRIRIYVGQENAPFTMENVTSSRWLDFMERSLAVRTLATPYNKADGIVLWGETPKRAFEYQVAVVGGDGLNRPNVDNLVDGMSRFVFRPLARRREDALQRFHFGFGARVGGRNPSFVRYNAPNLTTPGGFTFWSSTYTDTDGTKVAILPDNLQAAVSGEVHVPFERWDVRGEIVYLNELRREAPDANRTTTLREGRFFGLSGYLQVSVWLLGAARISGHPGGLYGVLRVPMGVGSPHALQGLQLVIRGELVRMNYASNSRSGPPGSISALTNAIDVNVFQIALNYWATKHIRLTAEYSLYDFPGNAATNQAMAPGRASNAMSSANVLNEFSFRLGLSI